MAILNLTLRARIFYSMLLLLLLSFLLTGAISIYHFWEENEEYHEKRLERKEEAVNASIDYFLKNYSHIEQDSLVFLLSKKIGEWSDVNNMAINIYSLSGELLLSSNKDKALAEGTVEQLEPETITALLKTERLVLEKETDTSLILLSYRVMHARDASSIAIVNLPYVENERIPAQDIDFLETLITLYLLLFGVAVIVAYFLSNYITSSLKTIGDRLNKTQFNKQNEPLEWRSKDEIGRLVQEYNRMLTELEENAISLAKKERESAWKEMAQQVAHEIKNPLTPMRLMVQHLEVSLKTDDKEKLKEFTQAMIDQIDTMTSIADAFSRFATLPDLKREDVELNELLERASLIYTHLKVKVFVPDEKVIVRADREQLLRVFNNLIKNSWQAIPEEIEPEIKLTLTVKDGQAIIEVKDNGSGIEKSRFNKIFEPSFTTKTQGMGLGLAMVKSIIEGVDGKIWFTTEKGKGSNFFVSIPRILKK